MKLNINNLEHLEFILKYLKLTKVKEIRVTKAGYIKLIPINQYMSPIITIEDLYSRL